MYVASERGYYTDGGGLPILASKTVKGICAAIRRRFPKAKAKYDYYTPNWIPDARPKRTLKWFEDDSSQTLIEIEKVEFCD